MKCRRSKQRDEIVRVLSRKNYHPTVDEIYARVKKRFSRISLATVYRNVEQLTRMNRIVKLDMTEGPARYDGNIEPHFHAVCTSCGTVEDVWLDTDLSDLIGMTELLEGFRVTGCDILFRGLCEDCMEKEKQTTETIEKKTEGKA